MSKLLPVLFVVILWGCDSPITAGPGGTADLSSFVITVRGDFTASYQGQATFGEVTDPDAGEPTWVLELAQRGSKSDEVTLWLVHYGARPGTGEHPIRDPAAGQVGVGAWFAGSSGGTSATARSTDGTLTITESSADRVAGSFTIQAEGTVAANGGETAASITISGEFVALDGVVSFPNL